MTGTLELRDGWELGRSPPGTLAGPDELDAAALQWREAKVPGTVASAIHGDIDTPGPYDADDWWYRTRFAAPRAAPGARYHLRFDGLATLAQVWFNGQPILASRNMFVGHRVDVTALLRDSNQLVMRFGSLEVALAQKRPRPRWRTALVGKQNLRWFRTTLLGRIPGWTPPIAPVGPWAPIALECTEDVEVTSLSLQARARGTTGYVQVRAVASRTDNKPLDAARLRLGEAVYDLEIGRQGGAPIAGDLTIENVEPWWPHTHGIPRRVACKLELRMDGRWVAIDCGMVGFKEIAIDREGERLRFVVNGVPVFCRGAVWTTMDILALRGEDQALRRALETARDGGINMLRVGGTMTYESEDFYRLCDELGILVWQDFMFANMDYPVADAEFRADIEAEARYQIGRLQRHACIAAYCGGSEIAQQAAMMGLPAEQWSNAFFLEALPALCEALHPGVPYFPSTPWGGALPFHVGSGVAHYFGVGAYRRPFSDARAARVKFTTECMGFSSVPEPRTMALLLDGATPPPHHPRWKARVPRDNGTGWDFEDVRDHYLRELFGCDPVALRSQDMERYFALSRVVPGEAMKRVFAEWRRSGSGCGGGLVWFYRDLMPGAGWGIVDSTGHPKATYWYLRRAWAPRTIQFTDEGLDGLDVHAVNDSADVLEATLELAMFRDGRVLTASAHADLRVPGRGAVSRSVDALVGHFTDSTNAYRFGPPKQDVVAVRMRRAGTGEVIADDFHFPLGLDLVSQRATAVRTEVNWRDDGSVEVTLHSDVFLQAVGIACEAWLPDDNHFHVAPNWEKRVLFVPLVPGEAFRADLQALNSGETISVRSQRPARPAQAAPRPASA